MKNLRHLFTALLLLCCIATKAQDFEVDNISYKITSAENKTVAVTYSYKHSGDIVIPETVTYSDVTYSVTGIDTKAFYDNWNVTSVSIPASVKYIGKEAFWNCRNLKHVNIPNGVTKIDDGTFSRCEYLNNVTIPNSVTYIGNSAFYGCYVNMTDITIPNSVTYIGSNAFYDCTNLTDIKISDNITYIGTAAFIGTGWMENQPEGDVYIGKWLLHIRTKNSNRVEGDIVIKDGTVGLAGNLLAKQEALTGVTLPNSLKYIGDEAFYNCPELTNLVLGDSIISIGKSAFRECSKLTSEINLPNITSIGDYAFYFCKGVTRVTLGDKLTTIGASAFQACTGLTSINIPSSVTSIRASAFDTCRGLTEVHITDLTAWCNISFVNGYSNPLHFAKHLYLNGIEVCELVIPDGITAIKQYSFNYYNGLKSIIIPSSVTNIEMYAFNGCKEITSIYLKCTTPPTITNNYVFTDPIYSSATLYVPQGTLSAYQNANIWKSFVNTQEYDATGIDDIKASNIAIEVTANGMALLNAEGKTITVYTPNGICVADIDNYRGEEITLEKGIYIVRVGNNTIKVII